MYIGLIIPHVRWPHYPSCTLASLSPPGEPATGQFDNSITSKALGDSDWGDSTLASEGPLSPRGGGGGGGGAVQGNNTATLGQKLKSLQASVEVKQ